MSLERILMLIDKYTDIPIDSIIITVAQDILKDMSNIDWKQQTSLIDSTIQGIQILDSLLAQNSKKFVSTHEKNKIVRTKDQDSTVFRVWETLIQTLIVSPSYGTAPQPILDFLTTCLAVCSKEMANEYDSRLNYVVSMLASQEEENPSDKFKNTLNFIETILQSTTSGLENFHDNLLNHLKDILLSSKVAMIETPVLIRITGIISSASRKVSKPSLFNKLWQDVYHALDEWMQEFAQNYCGFDKSIKEKNSQPLQTFLLLIDFLLEDIVCNPELHAKALELEQQGNLFTILNNPLIWITIQHGLCHEKSYTRKQALYNLKRSISALEQSKLDITVCVRNKDINASREFENECDNQHTPIFAWNQKSNSMIWSDLLLVAETLEENQLHVITPLLKRLDDLIEACRKSNAETFQLHTSWVCVLLLRMLKHESKAVVQEGIKKSLSLNACTFPFLDQEACYYFLYNREGDGLIPALQDANLYLDIENGSPVRDRKPPSIAKLIEDFIRNCMAAHPQPALFLKFLLRSLSSVNWSPVPLYYICSSIAEVKTFPAWNSKDLHVLGSVITQGLRTHNGAMRNAIQKLLLKILVSFCDCSSVTSNEVIRILLLCNIGGLIQNSPLFFKEISSWFSQNLHKFIDTSSTEQDVDHEAFLLLQVQTYLKESQSIDDKKCPDYLKDAKPCALLMVMTSECLTGEKQLQLRTKCLQILTMVTDKASTHLYMPADKVYKVIALLNHLVSWNFFEINDLLAPWQYVYKIIKGLTLFVAGRFPVHCSGIRIAELCLDVIMLLIKQLKTMKTNQIWHRELASNLTPMILSSNTVIGQTCSNDMIESKMLILNVVSIKCLVWACQLQTETSVKFNSETNAVLQSFLSSLDLQANKAPKLFSSDKSQGRTIEKYLTLQWSAIPHAVNLFQKNTRILEPISVMKSLLFVLDVVTEDYIPVYFQALQYLIPEVLKSGHKETEMIVCDVLDASWKIISSVTHSPAFWPVYDSFVIAVFQSSMLSIPASSAIHEKLTSIMSDVCALSVDKPGLLQRVSDACIASWVDTEISNGDHCEVEKRNKILNGKIKASILKNHVDFIVCCLTFSHAYKKEDLALCIAISMLGEESPEVTMMSSCNITIYTMAMLLQLDPVLTENVQVGRLVIQNLLQLDESMTQKKARYHSNSVQHHIKNKVYQAVILLLQFIPVEESEKTIEFLINQLKNDAQPSVRYLMEWTLAILLCRYPSNDGLLMLQLTRSNSDDGLPEVPAGSAKFSAVCSYLTVALFMGMGREHESSQDKYFLQLVDICIPWCMCQHFSIRLYAHAVVLKIKCLFQERGRLSLLLDKYPSLPSCLSFADQASGNVGRNWQKIKDNFFIFDLDPMKDLCLETVYSCLPRLCGLSNYMSLERLLTLFPGCNPDLNYFFRTRISLFNKRNKLRVRKSTEWIPQESKNVETAPNVEDRYRKNYGFEKSENVQKKIMPWFEQLQEAGEERVKTNQNEGLVLVASLIDKPSNLGGLTRTCEIFGAEALVVQSLSCTSNKLYQSLSVTAHKWLPMKEVKPWQLVKYLGKMRKSGYTLIGTEQTAQSVCLTKYSFPKKCVVVLGNEKEGIPIPILKVLDICVQIPQKGIVRSLNVHVSGAITVWEHARQQSIQRL